MRLFQFTGGQTEKENCVTQEAKSTQSVPPDTLAEHTKASPSTLLVIGAAWNTCADKHMTIAAYAFMNLVCASLYEGIRLL